MWDIQILGIDLYHVLFWLFLYSFLGWVWESSYVSVKEKHFVNRGFVTGPVCTIYGVGAVGVYLCLRPLEGHGCWLFLCGIVLATLLEYVTAWVMETVFHTSWWDYSDKPFNLKGRICAESSVMWGFLTLLMFDFLQPFVEWVVGLFSEATGHMIVTVCLIVYSVDFGISVFAAAQLGDRLSNLQRLLDEFAEYVHSTKVYESAEEMREAFGFNRQSFVFRDMQGKLEKIQETAQRRMEERGVTEHLESFVARAKSLREQYQEGFSKLSNVHRRFIKAYPNLHKNYRIRKKKEIFYE